MLQLTLNPGLTLTGFRTTRPCSLNPSFGDAVEENDCDDLQFHCPMQICKHDEFTPQKGL